MDKMEIAIVSKESIRIKGKQGAIVIDPPASGSKVPADAMLLLHNTTEGTYAVEGSRLTVYGPGEYEAAGIKISTVEEGNELIHEVKVDGVTVVVGRGELLSKVHEKLNEPHIMVVKQDEGSVQTAVTTLAPRVVLLYGPKAQEEAKVLGKEEVKSAPKYQATVEKLPGDMEVVVLQ